MRLCALLALFLVFVQLPVRADDRLERAKAIAERARTSAASGDYHAAAKAYREAFRLLPNAVVKYNEAESWYAAGEAPAAADAYEHALKMETLDAERTTRSKKLLVELERKLGVLVIEEPRGSVTVAHVRALALPARIHLEPGSHTVVVERDGERHQSRVTVAAGRAHPLVLPQRRPRPRPVPVPIKTAEPVDSGRNQRIVGFTSLALGAAAGIASAILGGMFLSDLDAFEDGGRTDAALRDRTLTLQAWTSGMAIAGAGLTGVGIILVVAAPNGTTF